MKKERGLALAACAALAALMLLFASQCSPLYPINLWDDANCLLTVGRVMRRGGVLYRDIYEQKGPLLYLIHALAACISDTSFWGVYVLEIPALTAALYAAYRLLRLRTGAGFALGPGAGGIKRLAPQAEKIRRRGSVTLDERVKHVESHRVIPGGHMADVFR